MLSTVQICFYNASSAPLVVQMPLTATVEGHLRYRLRSGLCSAGTCGTTATLLRFSSLLYLNCTWPSMSANSVWSTPCTTTWHHLSLPMPQWSLKY